MYLNAKTLTEWENIFGVQLDKNNAILKEEVKLHADKLKILEKELELSQKEGRSLGVKRDTLQFERNKQSVNKIS